MLPDRVSNPGPLTYESGALPIALRGLAAIIMVQALEIARPVNVGRQANFGVVLYNQFNFNRF